MIKFFVWERPFSERILFAREFELGKLFSGMSLDASFLQYFPDISTGLWQCKLRLFPLRTPNPSLH